MFLSVILNVAKDLPLPSFETKADLSLQVWNTQFRHHLKSRLQK